MRRALPWIALAGFMAYQARSSAPTGEFPVGSQLPPLSAVLSDGSSFAPSTSDQVIVLNFWASYCEPCRVEAPLLSRVQATTRDVKVVGLSVEPLSLNEVARRAQQLGMHFPVGVAGEALLSRLRVQSVPTTYVIGKSGKIVLSRVGVLSSRELEAALSAARSAS